MNINATLIVQVINFFIAYCLFRFILLKPAYRIIEQEQETRVMLEQLILDDKRLIEDRRREIRTQWQESHLFFTKHIPKPIDAVTLFKGTLPKIQVKPIDPMMLADVQGRLAQAVVKSVGGHYDRR